MNSRERVFRLLAGPPTDCLPAMPITMMFAADQIGRKYLDYSLDSRVLAEAQIHTATAFDLDHDASRLGQAAAWVGVQGWNISPNASRIGAPN